VLGQSYAEKRHYAEALRHIEKYQAITRNSAMSLSLAGYVHARLGQRTEALRALEQLSTASKAGFTPLLYFALVYAGLGDGDQAFAWLNLRRAVRANSRTSAAKSCGTRYATIRASPNYASVSVFRRRPSWNARFWCVVVVGPWGLEPQTSSVSRTRSNQLSYGPELGLD
jgi:hypothetical protein